MKFGGRTEGGSFQFSHHLRGRDTKKQSRTVVRSAEAPLHLTANLGFRASSDRVKIDILANHSLSHSTLARQSTWSVEERRARSCGHRMAHRKWEETKQLPSMLTGPAVPGSCLVSIHFLLAILCPQAAHQRRLMEAESFFKCLNGFMCLTFEILHTVCVVLNRPV